MAKLTHLIFYVKDILKGLSFYKEAFGIDVKFLHESEMYAELNTGDVALAFASDLLGKDNLPSGYIPNDIKQLPQSGEVVFTVKDVPKAYKKAVQAGGLALVPPKEKPWGQTVAYVRDPNGVLIEIASEMNG